MRTTLLLLVLFQLTESADVEGVVNLDEITFDKLRKKFDLLVKFDKQYAYGVHETAWKEVAKKAAMAGGSDFLCAQVGVQDYGAKLNQKLAERENVEKSQFPLIRLYKRNGAQVDLDEDLTDENLRRFLQTKGGLWLGLDGTVKALDDIAGAFISGDRPRLLEEAHAIEDSASKKHYIKIMEKIMASQDPDYLANEIARVHKIMGSKLSDAKRDDLQIRLNILSSFESDSRSNEEL